MWTFMSTSSLQTKDANQCFLKLILHPHLRWKSSIFGSDFPELLFWEKRREKRKVLTHFCNSSLWHLQLPMVADMMPRYEKIYESNRIIVRHLSASGSNSLRAECSLEFRLQRNGRAFSRSENALSRFARASGIVFSR